MDKLFQRDLFEDLSDATFLCHQSPMTGMLELLGKHEWPADILQSPHAEALLMLLWGLADLL